VSPKTKEAKMFRTGTLLSIFACLLLAATDLPAQQADYQVVVNVANPVSSMTAKQVSALFLKKTSTWANGVPVKAVDLPEDSAVRERFTRAVHGKSVSAIKSYWQQQIFTGRGTPPVVKASETEALSHVRANSGGVGYVSAGVSLGTNVKVLKVTGAGQ
jgi:hypothetical protein